MITGERIILRAWEKTDLEVFTRWFNDPEVTIYVNNDAYPCHSTEQEERYMASRIDDHNTYCITLRENGKPIGNCDIHKIDLRNRTAEVGIVIGEKEYWGRGYGREALRLLLEIGFEGMGLNRISLLVVDQNERAFRCYRAAGFREEGRLRQQSYIKGTFYDDIIMSVLASEYWEIRNRIAGDKDA
jgi:RimJ/RimL family protein N-acetyltransferase